MISDTCVEMFRKSLDEIMKMSATGLLDPHPRVRYEALTSLGLLLNELAPDAQKKFHDQLIAVLLKLMQEEQYIKLKTQATSCMVNFVRGLIDEEAFVEEPSEKQEEYGRILAPYSAALVQTISQLFELALQKNYAPLQEEVLGLLSCLANVLESKFAEHYGQFMPGLKQILNTMPMENKQQQELRAHCIQTIGFILTAVKQQPEVCKADALEVATVLTQLLNSGRVSEADP
jgi:importin-5